MKLTYLRTAPVRIVTALCAAQTEAVLPGRVYAEVDGLAITEWPQAARPRYRLAGQRGPDECARFGITHVASGTALGPWAYSRCETAEAALVRLAPLMVWTCSAETLRAELELRSLIDPGFPDRLRRALAPRGKRVPT